ncbi:4Fe-4S double cluster binding domain-containing protein [[Eubacterium] cellulosolvens]
MKESILQITFSELSKEYPCCKFASVPIHFLQDNEKNFFKSFMPEAISALVICHRITTIKEWTWYQPKDGHERCDADDHTWKVCTEIKNNLENNNFQSKIVPYPGESGLQFRYVAQSTGLGIIGRNAFFIHPEYGPWVHLRVLATTTPSENELSTTHLTHINCGDCSKCIDSCPAEAFNNGFNGLVCRKYRQDKGEYIPVGKERTYKYCLICALVCPLGEKPKRQNAE